MRGREEGKKGGEKKWREGERGRESDGKTDGWRWVETFCLSLPLSGPPISSGEEESEGERELELENLILQGL